MDWKNIMAAGDGWPESDLEYLGTCPVCSSSQRHLVFDDLEDWAFRVAPGKWKMWSCDACSTAYLDPRPNQASIGRAYESYYTHHSGKGVLQHGFSVKQYLRKIKFRMRLGYYRMIGSGEASVTDIIVGIVFKLIPNWSAAADAALRELRRPSVVRPRVLDIGCGSGEFLKDAAAFGYESIGVDPDERAVEVGREAGVDIRKGSLPKTVFPDSYFAQVTLNHTFEHLHWPFISLVEIWRILEPGGRLWMAMPNRDATGLGMFGKFWRGLEAPRHLILMNRNSLRELLVRASFSNIHFPSHPPCGKFFVETSLAQKEGLDLSDNEALKAIRGSFAENLARKIDCEARANPTRSEILIVTAVKRVR